MLRLFRSVFYTLLLGMVGLLVGALTSPPASWPASLADASTTWHPAVRTAVEGVWTGVDWTLAHPQPAAILAGVVLLPMFFAALLARLPRRVATDPVRLYTADQRRLGATLAGNRCEGEWLPFIRCRGAAAQGDHWYPWSLGGATSAQNLVMLCQPCNGAKSNHVPTFWQTQRLVLRRRRYFPPERDPRPGGKYGMPAGTH